MAPSAHFRPDYTGNGFVNLIASVVEARGGAPRHAPLAGLSVAEIRGAANILLIIVDGLGDRYIAANGQGGALARHRRAPISAVFPSTTASAITTSFTGATPLEHGLTGWFTYFSKAACVGGISRRTLATSTASQPVPNAATTSTSVHLTP